jgi:hypothetical protein
MAIEFKQIHSVVRTYHRSIHVPPSARQDVEQAEHVEQGQITISPHAKERDVIHLTDEIFGITK